VARIYVAGSRGKREIVLGKRDAHYLKDVLRMKNGDRVIVLDGDEGEGYKEDISRNHVNITVSKWKKIERGIGLSIVLGQSILKGEKMDMVIEKATEIGVDSIIPLVTERVIPRYSGNEKKRRWERITSEAARLCGRPVPPKLSAPVTLGDFLKISHHGPGGEGCSLKIVPWEEEKGVMFSDLLIKKMGANPASHVAQGIVVMGPEGGFSEGEVILLRKAGFKTVSLGSLILRSETATIYTLSCLAGFYGGKYE